ncbi:MAG: glycosyltransferase family protein [Anaerolineaceae bacterium]|jgi:spore coat polysaccharide biosynthesis protein SpsF|nr:glycosyltransferase family protein [Anaerolineaceae bacterium]
MTIEKKKRTVAIIQARMGSSRLPGKVMQEIDGRPMLEWVITRAGRAKLVDEVAVATTTDASDDPIETYCKAHHVPVYRGDAFDVLDRYYQAARVFQADVIVRLTADCPLLDPYVVDQTVRRFFTEGADFAANRLPPPFKRTFPIGLDTEVCSFAALERAWKEADQKYQREHVMPYLYDTKGRFKVVVVNNPEDFGDQRWTVDTPEDLEFVRQVAAGFGHFDDFNWMDVLALLDRNPALLEINAQIKHKTMKDVDERNEN